MPSYFKIGPLVSQINVEFNITDRQTSRQTIQRLQSEKLRTEKGRDIHIFCFHCLLTGIWCEVILMELMSRQLSENNSTDVTVKRNYKS